MYNTACFIMNVRILKLIFLQPRTPNEWNLYHVNGRDPEFYMIAARFHY